MNDRFIQQAVSYLKQAQGRDGGFVGQGSLQATDFSHPREHPTTFFTALILNSLHDVPGTEALQGKAADFLLNNKSTNWSWNYLVRDADPEIEGSYPDDLDDTVCALAGLHRYSPELIDGTTLGHVSQLLITNEETAGGPYGTWLVDHESSPQWHNVDIAVNANIGYFLSLKSVHLPGLTAYVTRSIMTDALDSTYYIGQVPVIYFLARWYQGEAVDDLRKLVHKGLREYQTSDNALTLALLISAGCNLDCPKALLELALKQLLKLRINKHWAAAAFCYGPPIEGEMCYAGSDALSTAFALEALIAYDLLQVAPEKTPTPKPHRNSSLMSRVIADSKIIKEPELRLRYRSFARLLIEHDRDSQITNIASYTAEACRQRVQPKILQLLNLASLYGWMAYTIYDDILDGEANATLLGVANVAQRQMIAYFQRALPAHQPFQTLVHQSLMQVDSINTWEVIRARASVRSGVIRIRKLPNYANYDALWQRSWGHMLAASGVLTTLGYKQDSNEQIQLQSFFRHFLVARQLNDDAHDWETDLTNGHCSAVVTLLLKDYCQEPIHIDLGQELGDLQVHFWQKTILKVAELIQGHVQAAEQGLTACTALKDTTVYQQWLAALSEASEQALTQRHEAQAFIHAYETRATR